jgi:hypothetical protein
MLLSNGGAPMPAKSLARAVAVLSLLALGCRHGSSPSEPTPARQDAISLISISPAERTVLPYGSTVDVTARVRYSFASAVRGKISLIAYGGNRIPTGPPIFTDPVFFAVEGRDGEATLRSTIYFDLAEPPLPKSSPITLDFSIFPEGVDRTSIGFTVLYQLGS